MFHLSDVQWNTNFKYQPWYDDLPPVRKLIRICKPDSYAPGYREWHNPCESYASTESPATSVA